MSQDIVLTHSEHIDEDQLREELNTSAQIAHPDGEKVLEAQDIVANMVSLEVKERPLEDLIGRVAQYDVFTTDGTQIVAVGEHVNTEHLERARNSGFEAALTTAVGELG